MSSYVLNPAVIGAEAGSRSGDVRLNAFNDQVTNYINNTAMALRQQQDAVNKVMMVRDNINAGFDVNGAAIPAGSLAAANSGNYGENILRDAYINRMSLMGLNATNPNGSPTGPNVAPNWMSMVQPPTQFVADEITAKGNAPFTIEQLLKALSQSRVHMPSSATP